MPSNQRTMLSPLGIITERNHYFTGKYMTARDFAGEQDYMLSRHYLHNRLLHGWGVVCGLRVVPHPDITCQETWVRVRAGIAIDCYGRELFLQHDEAVPLPNEFVSQKPDNTSQSEGEAEIDPLAGAQLLMMFYKEHPIEHIPVLYDTGTCDTSHEEANRIREEIEFKWVAWEEANPDCWKQPGGSADASCRKDCDHPIAGSKGVCLEPDCVCDGGVPLALITYRFNGSADPKDNCTDSFCIDMDGRHQLPMSPDMLTKITYINWPHGGSVSLADLQERNGRLEIHFDRPLRSNSDKKPEEEEFATGVNEFTFEVRHVGGQQDYELVEFENIDVINEGRTAVFDIAEKHYRQPEGRDRRRVPKDLLDGKKVSVTLRCDFVLDCLGNPVDGDHLCGRLPSGNGIRGGIFTSWFYVTYTDEEDGSSENE